MNILDMHILLDTLINKVNSNVWGSVQPEEKDGFFNSTIRQFVGSQTIDPPSSEIDDYQVLKSYQGMENLIRTYKFTTPRAFADLGYYESGSNPKAMYCDFTDLILSVATVSYLSKPADGLIAGNLYKLLRYYTDDDFTSVNNGVAVTTEGTTFTAKFASTQTHTFATPTVLVYDYNLYHTNTSGQLLSGVTYTVLSGTVTFTATLDAYGIYVDGILYTSANTPAAGKVVNAGSKLKINGVLTVLAAWPHGSVLQALQSGGEYYDYIRSSSRVSFNCGNGTEYKTVPNRLVRSKDADAFNDFSYGTIVSSPFAILQEKKLVLFQSYGNLRVPSTRQFAITDVYLTYYKKPALVNIHGNADCDLDDIVHDKIVRDTAETILAAINGGTWDKLRVDNQKKVIKQ